MVPSQSERDFLRGFTWERLVRKLELLGLVRDETLRAESTALPHARVRQSAAQTINNVTVTAITFDGTEDYDTGGFHSPTTNNARLTAPASKLYLVRGQVYYSPAAVNGAVAAWIYRNSDAQQVATDARAWLNSGAYGTCLGVTALVRLAAGDYVELRTFQDTGAARGIDETQSFFEITEVSDYA